MQRLDDWCSMESHEACTLLQHAITRSHPQPEELMDVEPAPTSPPNAGATGVAPSAGVRSSVSMVQHPAQHPADALANAASPPASAPLIAVNETPSAGATPQQPPTPHKGPVNGAGPSQHGGSVSPCVTDAAARLSLQSPSSKVCGDAVMPSHHLAVHTLFALCGGQPPGRLKETASLQFTGHSWRCLASGHWQRAAAAVATRRTAL